MKRKPIYLRGEEYIVTTQANATDYEGGKWLKKKKKKEKGMFDIHESDVGDFGRSLWG